MTTLYFMRHAESEANLADILASQIDFPLTNKGLQDATQIAAEFQEQYQIDHIISSPLTRAQQTATPFEAINNLTLTTDARVIEQHLGIYAGKTYIELESEISYCHDRALRWNWIPEGGGESYSMIEERLQPFFDDMFMRKEENILIITHAVTLRIVKAILQNTQPEYPHDIAHNGEIWKVKLIKKGEAHSLESIYLGESKNAKSKA
jgi:broad specificity phosphatase PhoE